MEITTQNLWGGTPLWKMRARAIAATVRDSDIVLLQEVRARRSTQAHELAEMLALTFIAFAPAGRAIGGTEGVALLSRFPILHSATCALPQNPRDWRDRIAPRVLLRTVLDTPDGVIDAYPIHLSLSPAARQQAVELFSEFHTRQQRLFPTAATILGGDFNAPPEESSIRQLASLGFTDVQSVTTLGPRGTYPAIFPQRRFDYLWTSTGLDIESCRHVASHGSDHAAVRARVRLRHSPHDASRAALAYN